MHIYLRDIYVRLAVYPYRSLTENVERTKLYTLQDAV